MSVAAIPSAQTPSLRDAQRIYSIAELSREFAITPRTIRFYEDEGLIKPRRHGTTRLYTAGDRTRLSWILRGKRLGFSLAEIRELLDLYQVDRTGMQQLRELRCELLLTREQLGRALVRRIDEVAHLLVHLLRLLGTLTPRATAAAAAAAHAHGSSAERDRGG
jgi:DNA-binding transcriptional MerR regulator